MQSVFFAELAHTHALCFLFFCEMSTHTQFKQVNTERVCCASFLPPSPVTTNVKSARPRTSARSARDVRCVASRRAPAVVTTTKYTPARAAPVSARVNVQIEAPAVNKRTVNADVLINAPIDIVWEVLSDYGRLSEYIPNLAQSDLRAHPEKNGIRVEQCGVQSILGFKFRASVTMDMVEIQADNPKCRAIEFYMVESRDFREFFGVWKLDRIEHNKTALYYSVSIVPRGLVPVRAIEWRISEDVPQNMDAVKQECEARRRSASAQARRARLARGDLQ